MKCNISKKYVRCLESQDRKFTHHHHHQFNNADYLNMFTTVTILFIIL